MATGKHVAVVGLGNIGSHLVAYLARLASAIRHLTLVDFDSYDESNVISQHISSRDLGRPKAAVLARQIRRLNSELAVTALVQSVEDVPVGLLRADLILAAVDSNLARQTIAQVGWRLGVPVVDTGVAASQRLARVSVFIPAPDAACISCQFTAADIANLETRRWCSGGSAPSTNAPAWLGALAASLAAAECEKLLAGRIDQSLAGHDVIVGVGYHSHAITRHVRRPDCPFDHRTWGAIEVLDATPDQVSLASALRLGSEADAKAGPSRNGSAQLRLAGQTFVTQRRCCGCGTTEDLLFLSGRLRERACPQCGEPLLVVGFYSKDSIAESDITESDATRSLRSLGVRRGDVISVCNGARERHIQLGC